MNDTQKAKERVAIARDELAWVKAGALKAQSRITEIEQEVQVGLRGGLRYGQDIAEWLRNVYVT